MQKLFCTHKYELNSLLGLVAMPLLRVRYEMLTQTCVYSILIVPFYSFTIIRANQSKMPLLRTDVHIPYSCNPLAQYSRSFKCCFVSKAGNWRFKHKEKRPEHANLNSNPIDIGCVCWNVASHHCSEIHGELIINTGKLSSKM